MRYRLATAAVLLALASADALAADRVLLHGGAIAEGRLVSESETEIVLRQGEREIRIPRANVKLVDRESERPAAAPGSDAPTADAAAAAPAGTPAKPVARAPAVVPAVDARILAALTDASATVRAAALEDIVRAWPTTRATLEAALAHKLDAVRLAAVQLLDRPELGETRIWVLHGLSDTSPDVRRAAIRITRGYRDPTLEPRMIEALTSEADAGVRVEALRCLELIGSPACLPAVFDQFEREATVSSRRRWLRVLKRISGEDHGEDVQAWREAVTRLRELGRRTPVARADAAPEGAAIPPDAGHAEANAAPATATIRRKPETDGATGGTATTPGEQ